MTDADGDVSTATVTINVASVDDLPVAVADSINTNEDTPVTGSLAGNDTASGDGGNVWSLTTGTTNGTVTVSAAGVYNYTPNANYFGSDSFTYSITDADGDVSTATVTINVAGTNDAAVITGTSIGSVTEASGVANAIAGTPTATGTLISTDIDNPATFTAVSTTTSTGGYGTYQMTAGGVWTYTINNSNAAVQALNTGGTLTDTFTVASIDGTAKVVTVTLHGANDAAVITGTSTGSVTEASGVANAIVGTPTATGTLTDTDVDNPVNTFTAVAAGAPSTNGYGTYAMTAGGIWTYTLNNNNSTIQALNVGGTLSDTFTVTSVDGTPRLVTVTINGTNDTPIGVVESFVVTEGTTAILGNVLANDTDVDSSSLSVGQFAINASGTGAQAANGTNFITTALGGIVVMNANGTFTYTAPTSRNHSDATPDIDSFVYRASDGTATSDWTTVSINLADTGPVAYSDTASLSGGGSISGNVITGTGNIVVGGADTLGADAVSITNVTVTQGTVVSNTVGAGNVRTIVTTNGTLVIDQDDGSYTYTKATDKSVAAGTNAATQAVWTAAGFNTYGYDTPVAAGIYNSPFVGGSPANGINFTSMTATQAGYVRYRNNGGTGDDGLGVESVAGTSANNKIENNEHLLIDIGLSSQSATITLTDLTLLETATWRAYAADGSFISGATGTVNGVLSGVVSATITTMSPFAYLVVSSTGNAFRIDGLTVTPVAMTTSNIFTYTLTDADGSTSSATLTINPGIAPVIDLDASGVGNGFATAFTQGGAAVSIADTDISITDADSANITKATITLTNAQAGDVLTAGTLPGGITVSIVGNVVTLTGSTTLANYQTAIRAITFSTTSTNTASRSIDVVVTDGVNNSNTATTTVAVSLLNAPVIDLDLSGAGTGFATTYTENGVAVSIADTDISITDVDSTNMTGATITLTNAQAGDVLSAGILPGGISSSVIGNVVTLSGVSSLANYQAAIRAITFANSTENPNVTPRVISVVVTDGISNSNTATTTIAVTAVNDAPVNTVPGVQVTAEDTSKAIIGLSVSDVDAGSSMTVTLSVTNGTLTVTGGSATITGSGTGTVTLTGTVAAINATLASNVTYLSAPNYYGNDTLTMTTSDNGNTGTGGALIDVDTVNITITSVTDAPQIIMPASLSSVHAGTPTAAINTTTAITQANIETALGLPAGSLDNRFDPPTGGANDPGAVDVFDGAYTNYAITLAAGTQVAFDWSFFNGELVLSEINNGYNDVAVLVITDPNGVVNYQLLSSSEQTGINVNGATVDATGTVNYTPAITGQYQFSWLVLNAIDGNNDSQLSVGAPKTFYNGNSYGAPITFPINVLPVGDETIGLITISGLPLSGIGFSFIGSNGVAVGTNLGGGSWSFTESQLSSLQLLTPPDYVGTINLTVSAIGTENGIDATATQNISIEVAATTVNVMGTQTGNTLTGSAANDLIDGLGGNDTIDGGSGNDILSGGAGNDNLSGGIGNDLLMGGAGSDTLNGGAGNDTLIGGAGNDTMTGGLGMDVFKWELADKGAVGTPAADIVTDFDVATRVAGGDVLDLRDILTGENHTTGTGNLTNYLHFEKSGANTIVHISDSGAYAGGFNSASDVQIITLQGVDLVTGFANDQAIIQQLLTQQKLITD
ncbi:MAG: VCBS domain-containing protein [Pseudomonadota bacterium]